MCIRDRLYYGDREVVATTYDHLRRYVDYVESKARDGVLSSYTPTARNENWMFIGDWARPAKVAGRGFNMDGTPEREFFNNCYRALLWQQLQDYAATLGRADEVNRCKEHLAIIRPLIHNKFYNTEKGAYIFNNQSHLAMALYAQIPPAELRPKIMDSLLSLIHI